MAPEDEKKPVRRPPVLEGPGPHSAAAMIAALATVADPGIVPQRNPEFELQRIAELEADRDRITAMHQEKVQRMGELAADRDRWKVRAEKAEVAADGLALERVTKERDVLKTEVSKLMKRLLESNKEKGEEIAQLKATLKVSMADANEAASQTARFQTTMEQAIKARDRAKAEREEAVNDRIVVVKRVADLEEQITQLKDKIKEMMPVKSGAGSPIPAKVGTKS